MYTEYHVILSKVYDFNYGLKPSAIRLELCSNLSNDCAVVILLF